MEQKYIEEIKKLSTTIEEFTHHLLKLNNEDLEKLKSIGYSPAIEKQLKELLKTIDEQENGT
jgi:hypothetical protein